jgi:hypothetical protein
MPRGPPRRSRHLTEVGLVRLGEAHPTHLAGVHKFFLEHFAKKG